MPPSPESASLVAVRAAPLAARDAGNPFGSVSVQRLRGGSEIHAVLAAGNTARGSALSVHVRRRPGRHDRQSSRAAVVAGRRVGGAVQRNRAKRRLRSALRAVGVPAGLDVVVVARPATLTLPFAALLAQASRLLDEAAGLGGSG